VLPVSMGVTVVVLVSAMIGLCIWNNMDYDQFTKRCHSIGGHVITVHQYKSSTDYCLNPTGGIIDVR
jgi:hypothetical protein